VELTAKNSRKLVETVLLSLGSQEGKDWVGPGEAWKEWR